MYLERTRVGITTPADVRGRDLEAATADNARHLRQFERNEDGERGEIKGERRRQRWIHLLHTAM